MRGRRITRRNFLQATVTGSAGIILTSPLTTLAGTSTLIIKEPFHGAVLNRRHGQKVEAGLKIKVTGQAPLRDSVTVNGKQARRAGTEFIAEVVLRKKETDIVAISRGSLGRQQHHVRVVWDRYSFPRYRVSIDDNIFFLRDIAQKKYESLFDSWYLKMLKNLHDKYGTRFVLNIYYSTDADDRNAFDLTQLPDSYKNQWRDNSDWLKLSFHAYSDKPARPYQYATPEKIISDMELVSEQIRRFAGEQTYSPPTVIHWAMVPQAALRPLYEHGVRVLSADCWNVNGGWDINYFLDDDRSEYLRRHDALKDFDSGIVFSYSDITINNTPIEHIVPLLERAANDPNRAEIMDLFTHEQQFWPFEPGYQPEHPKKLETAVRWVTEHAYKPVFFHEAFLGAPE